MESFFDNFDPVISSSPAGVFGSHHEVQITLMAQPFLNNGRPTSDDIDLTIDQIQTSNPHYVSV